MIENNKMWKIPTNIYENDDITASLENNVVKEPISSFIQGYIINADGYIIDKFIFETIEDMGDKVRIQIPDVGYLGAVYNKTTPIIIGYGNENAIPGVTISNKTLVLNMGPEMVDDDGIYIELDNDDDLKKCGINIIMRLEDLVLEKMDDAILNKIEINNSEAKEQIKKLDELNELEIAYLNYFKHMYEILSENV